jgi:hypothetical protein
MLSQLSSLLETTTGTKELLLLPQEHKTHAAAHTAAWSYVRVLRSLAVVTDCSAVPSYLLPARYDTNITVRKT